MKEGLPETLAAVPAEFGLNLNNSHIGKAPVDFRDNALLLGNRREGDRKLAQLCQVDRSQVRGLFPLTKEVVLAK